MDKERKGGEFVGGPVSEQVLTKPTPMPLMVEVSSSLSKHPTITLHFQNYDQVIGFLKWWGAIRILACARFRPRAKTEKTDTVVNRIRESVRQAKAAANKPKVAAE